MHHYVFDLLLLYQPLSSACVLSFSFLFFCMFQTSIVGVPFFSLTQL